LFSTRPWHATTSIALADLGAGDGPVLCEGLAQVVVLDVVVQVLNVQVNPLESLDPILLLLLELAAQLVQTLLLLLCATDVQRLPFSRNKVAGVVVICLFLKLSATSRVLKRNFENKFSDFFQA